MIHDLSLQEMQRRWHGTLRSYVMGFTASILLTLVAFLLVITHFLTGQALVWTLIGLGIVQALAQLRYFLHLGDEKKPRWEFLTFLFMALVLLIIVIGSLWIMYDLNERVMAGM